MSSELERLLENLLALTNEEDDLDEVEIDLDNQDSHMGEESREVPILPVRGLVMYPNTVIPLNVGQARSLRLVEDIMQQDRVIGLFASVDPTLEEPDPDDLYPIGTLVTVHRFYRTNDGSIRLLVQGLHRIAIDEFTAEEPYLKALVHKSEELIEEGLEVEAYTRNIVDQAKQLASLTRGISEEFVENALNVEDPLSLIYSIATYLQIDLEKAQEILEIDSLTSKLRLLLRILTREVQIMEIGRQLQEDAQDEMEKSQREYFLREQMKAIQRELDEGDDQFNEIEDFRKAIADAGMPEEAIKEANREVDRLSKLPLASAEYGVIRTYLEWLISLPWQIRSEDILDISKAREVLDTDHYGLQDIKERILEFLAVRKLRQERAELFEEQSQDSVRRDRNGAILCFVGPPGVGKTSLGASIAHAMGRKFIRMSLGGIRDEAEIRGFRRTYIGAMPGRIIQSIRRANTRNPVMMLDEVDKIGRDYRGDPTAALLEVLDPEQNFEFRDHYMDLPFDLSDVLFITTANDTSTIPAPLLDRMEVIQLNGYTENEKLAIARQYLVERQLRENGLFNSEVTFQDDALLAIIRDYTREAGVRTLEREIGRVTRKLVTHIAEGDDTPIQVDSDKVYELLGKQTYAYRTELQDRADQPGIATGLAWTPVGGDVLFIEATLMPGKKGFKYTGQLGDVMQESAQIAWSYVRSKAEELGVEPSFFENNDIHLHVPAGAVPKDGPSAGITMAVALASLLTHRATKKNIAMTGEITLNGSVLPVGGIKDKILAAHRLGVDTVLIPKKNENDLDDVPEEVRKAMHFIPIEHMDNVLNTALVN